MKRDRLKKARRIQHVQGLLLRTAEWRAAAILRERNRLEAERQDLLASMGGDLFGPLLVEQAARRLSHVALQSTHAAAAQAAQDEQVRKEGCSLKRAARAVRTVEQATRAAEDRARTTEIAEESAARRFADASLA